MTPPEDGGARSWFANPAARDWRCATPSSGVTAFHATLPGYAPTPLTDVPELAAPLGVGRVLVKDESHRLGLPAFKILGASWAVARVVARRAGLAEPVTLDALRVAAQADPVTLVTATDGNHGRAVARVAGWLGLGAKVFVPAGVPAGAVAAIASEGADVVVLDESYDDAVAAAAAAAGASGTVLVQDTAWPSYEEIPGWIVDGYDTLCIEIDEQLRAAATRAPDLVVVPMGVGSLAQAVVTHYRREGLADAPAVLGVEPGAAACVLAGLLAGRLRSVDTTTTNMAGLNCGTPSSLAWPVLHAGLDAAVAVADHDASAAVDDLAALGISSGPSGAATLAGVRAALTGPDAGRRRAALRLGPDSTVVLLSTEGRDAVRSPTAAG
jgi:diaminopropionate ammonia-lyase